MISFIRFIGAKGYEAKSKICLSL